MNVLLNTGSGNTIPEGGGVNTCENEKLLANSQ
jgi:hypothetical protein